MQHQYYTHPQGVFALVAEADCLLGIVWRDSRRKVAEELEQRYPSSREQASPFLAEAWSQLAAYLEGKARQLELPYDLRGVTSFQQRVLQVLRDCPYGTTLTYGELARRAGSPRAARAVGTAMAVNPLPLLIPCHRVVGAGGKLTGYSGGQGLASKRYLLTLEGDEKT